MQLSPLHSRSMATVFNFRAMATLKLGLEVEMQHSVRTSFSGPLYVAARPAAQMRRRLAQRHDHMGILPELLAEFGRGRFRLGGHVSAARTHCFQIVERVLPCIFSCHRLHF